MFMKLTPELNFNNSLQGTVALVDLQWFFGIQCRSYNRKLLVVHTSGVGHNIVHKTEWHLICKMLCALLKRIGEIDPWK